MVKDSAGVEYEIGDTVAWYSVTSKKMMQAEVQGIYQTLRIHWRSRERSISTRLRVKQAGAGYYCTSLPKPERYLIVKKYFSPIKEDPFNGLSGTIQSTGTELLPPRPERY